MLRNLKKSYFLEFQAPSGRARINPSHQQTSSNDFLMQLDRKKLGIDFLCEIEAGNIK